MNTLQWCQFRAISVMIFTMATQQVLAQDGDASRITKEDKDVYQKFVDGRKQKASLTQGLMNLRQIGIAMLEFEVDYGEFPNEKTAVLVKEATETKAELKGVTADDCFYQLMAAGILEQNLFSFEDPAAKPGKPKMEPGGLGKCVFSYVSGMNTTGNPSRPLIVAPLVKGQTTFDPKILAGKALILRMDNSVQSLPIEKDGRVLIDGKDLFDPTQPYWGGVVPPLKWPKD